jgi:methanogenic corrinoid protein MtbC1
MARVGELWTAENSGVFWEHRATQIVMQSLVRLRSFQAIAFDAPLAVGGAPAGDAYMLPSLAVATVLEAQGIRAVNLGAETPIETLALGVEDLNARVAWLSVSVAATPGRLREEILSVLPVFAERGTTLVVGGAAATKLKLPASEQVYVGTSMVELEALLAGMKLGETGAAAGLGRLQANWS